MKSRHLTRKQLAIYLEIIDPHTQALIGHVGDISSEGVMVLADKPLPLNKVMDIVIKLPSFEEFSKTSIAVRIQTRWSKMDVNPTLYRTGCHFLHIDIDDLPLIEQVEEVLGFF